MKIFLKDLHRNFDRQLEDLIQLPVMNYDKTALPEKVSTIDLSTERTPQELNLDFLFNYQIFPANIMVHRAQWDVEKRKMKVGDTLLQQIFIPPINKFSQKIIFGVRINRAWLN